MGVLGAVMAVASVASGAIGAASAGKAAGQQASAANRAADLQMSQFQQGKAELQPFVDAGTSSLPDLLSFGKQSQNGLDQAFNTAQNAVPTNVSNETIQNMPGYQFNLAEGQKAVANANASKGLGVSGTALKAAGNFATGLADNYYQHYFSNANTIYQDQAQQFSNKVAQDQLGYNMLLGPAQLGEQAAAAIGYQGNTAAANAGTNIAGAGQAQAAGTTAAGNAISNGINGIGSSLMAAQFYNKLFSGSPATNG